MTNHQTNTLRGPCQVMESLLCSGENFLINFSLENADFGDPMFSHIMVFFNGLRDFKIVVVILLLLTCTCAYIRGTWKSILDSRKTRFPFRIFWKFARIGERCSPLIGTACLAMGCWVILRPY